LGEARERERSLERLTKRRKGESERAALRRLLPGVDRSNFRRWKQRFEEHGLDGLFDWRMPPPSAMTAEVRSAICTLRRADPQVGVESIVEHIATHHGMTTNATSVKEVLREAGLARRRGPAARAQAGEVRLELGGMKLLEVAGVETGYLEALTRGVMAEREAAVEVTPGTTAVDTSDRDEEGRFLASYNERYRKGPEDEVGPGFASVEERRAGMDSERLHLNGARQQNIERKLLALLVSPLLGSGRWDGIRVPRGDLLGELCGYPYMPSTLDLFTRELKYVGVSSTLWEIHARLWFEQTRRWGDERQAAVLYVDETNKPVWTDLFSEATAVSSVGRVMPGLEIVSFHLGYGVPLWMITHSGRAPLVKVVPELLGELQQMLDGAEVGRIVVIDAEGNSVPFVKGLEQGQPARGWVTRLKPSMIEGKRIFNRTNFRPYRDGDRVRVGECNLNDPGGGEFRIRVVEVERRSKGSITYLGASKLLDDEEWKAQEIADLYFARWPEQEANFRAVNQAVGFKDVHGYGKQMVDNVSVLTELDKLDVRVRRLDEQAEKAAGQLVEQTAALMEQEKELRRLKRREETVNRQVDKRLKHGVRVTPKLRALGEEQQELRRKVSAQAKKLGRQQQKVRGAAVRANRIKAEFARCNEQREKLESRRRIFKHDVELDSLISLLKVGMVLLVTYVLKEYLGNARMEPVTFLERLAALPARLRLTPELELVTFDYNHRDPDVMAILAEHCAVINARQLRTRSGRVLRIQVDPAPPPRRPPPPARRVNPGDRFRPN